MQDAAKEVYRSKKRWRSLVANVWAHDLVERLKIRRKMMAKDCGLGDVEVGTYPSHPATIINQGSMLSPILMGLGLLGGGVIGGMGLSGLFDRVAVPPPAKSSPMEFDLEIIGTDGGIKASVAED